MDIYDDILKYLEEGKTGLLATVVNKAGSAPREEGAKMFVGEDGKSFGTVGGGQIEAEVYDEALKRIGAADAKMLCFRLDAKTVEERGMICGGDVDILLEPVRAIDKAVFEGARFCESRGRRAVLMTSFGKGNLRKALLDAYGETWGEESAFENAGPFLSERRTRLIDNDLLIEPITAAPPLYIFGAGHVALFLAKMAKLVDFKVVVIDDRADFANQERFPEVDEILVTKFGDAFEHLCFTGNEYVVIVTRGHQHDALVLEESLKQKTAYVGMIGSSRKVSVILDHLRKKGVSEAELEAVHSPIGIGISAETPQEIAVSILAQLIEVRAAM